MFKKLYHYIFMKTNLTNIFTQEEISPEIPTFVDTLIDEITEGLSYYYSLKIAGKPSYEKLKKSNPEFRKAVMSHMIQTVKYWRNSDNANTRVENACEQTVALMMRSKQDFTEQEFVLLLEALKESDNNFHYWTPVYAVLSQLEKFVKKNPIADSTKEFLKGLTNFSFPYREGDKSKLKIKEILVKSGDESIAYDPVILEDQEDNFGKAINEFTNALEDRLKAPYYRFLALSRSAQGGKPTQKFYNELQAIVKEIGEEDFKNQLKNWLILFKNTPLEKKINTYSYNNQEYSDEEYTFIHPANLVVIKGMIWAIQPYADQETLQALAIATEKCFQKIPYQGPVAAAVGNACIYTLGHSGLLGISFLSRLKLKLRQANTKSLIENYIRQASKELGVTPSQVEDMAVPDFALKNYKIEKSLGDYHATLSIATMRKTQIEWKKTDGKVLKSVPAAVKNDFKAELKALRDTVKQIQMMLTAQRDRLDRGFIEDRVMSRTHFDQYYFKHGLMGYLTTQLIWSFELDGEFKDAFYLNDTWVDEDDKVVKNIDQAKKVKLWHPIHKNMDNILDWRNFLTRNEIRQPLKQAYREIYILTDAEVNTHNYSNRMAAHILKQHQFNSLAKLRGWKYSLLGAYDKGYDTEIATINLPDNHKAEFWVQEVYAEDEWTDSGIFNYVSTDQVRFYQNSDQLAMSQIPPMIFSEVMRDVDLFVGVASVGNDPNWRDGGLQQYRNYWESYSFGDLNELAKTRKQVLEKLIPRLKIAKQCSLTEKFLVVEGKIRTYKIHMGSGNILMEPNDQYLCIVPDRKSETFGDKVFLPFEGDNILSIIISKAFLLAEDTKIKDSTILSQLKRK